MPKTSSLTEGCLQYPQGKEAYHSQSATGWGKSFVIVCLILHKLLKHPNLRCVIAVPQTLIGNGFVRDWKIGIGRKVVSWVVSENLCHAQACDTIQRLTTFLSSKHSSLGDRVLLCTHATLAHTYKRLKAKKQLNLFTDTMIWIDEGHHVMNAQVIGGGTISNSIGG